MKKQLRFALCLLLLVGFMITGCQNQISVDSEATEETTQEQKEKEPITEKADYTLFLYLCGSNLESRSGFAGESIADILRADLPENTNLIVETGGTKKWHTNGIPNHALCRYSVQKGALQKLEELPLASMGNPATLSDFLVWGVEKFPAKQYGLILWDHGGGSLDGICFDEHYPGDSLSLSELSASLGTYYKKANQKLDFIGFDACLMATYDTVKTVAPYADYMIASEENEPSDGWDYQAVASIIGKPDFHLDILLSYANKCEKAGKKIYTLSNVDLAKFGALESAFSDFISYIGKMPLSETVKAAKTALGYGTNFEGIYSNLIDLSMFAHSAGHIPLQRAISSCTETVNGLYQDGSGGISFFYPLHDMASVNTYLSLFGSGNYADFLRTNYTKASPDLIAVKDVTEKDGKMQITVDADDVKYIADAVYYLFDFSSDGEKETVYALGKDSDIVFDGNNIYTVNFRGYWMTLAGETLYTDMMENDVNYTEFASPVKVNGQKAELRFIYDKNSHTVTLQGYLLLSDGGSRLTDLQNGDTVTVMQYDRSDLIKTWTEGKTFLYDAKLQPEIHPLKQGYYQYTALFTDIYGRQNQVATAVVYYDGERAEIQHITKEYLPVDMNQ